MKSLLRRVVFMTAALAVSVGPARAQAPSPAAVVTSCSGTVTVIRAGAPAPAVFGTALHPGDGVRTGGDGKADIVFAAGNWVQIGRDRSMKIEDGAGADGASPRSGRFLAVRNFLELMGPEGTVGSGEEPPALEPVGPNQTRLRTARPTFRWRLVNGSTGLRLTVYGKGRLLWETDVVGGTEFAYPADAPALEPGVVYSWVLESADSLASPALRTPPSFFELIAPADAETLATDLSQLDANRPGPVTYRVLRASLFFDRGLVEDAIVETEFAVAADPDNASLHTILGRLYAEAGRVRDATAAMNRARK